MTGVPATEVARAAAPTPPIPGAAGCSVIVPVYRNRESLPELLNQLEGLDRELGGRLEAVFVVDGSHDDSLAWLAGELPRRPLLDRSSSRCRATSARSLRYAPVPYLAR